MKRPDLELCDAPRWRAEDLGAPLPESPHAVSVCMPLWQHVVDYEEGRAELRSRLRAGYPRFVLPRAVDRLRAALAPAAGPEACLPFPSHASAARCLAYVAEKTGLHGEATGAAAAQGVHLAVFPPEAFAQAKAYWQHFGEIVSTRRAEAALDGTPEPPGSAAAKTALRARIAALAGARACDVHLHPSGMAALTAALRAVQSLRPGARTIQLGFPYVDVLKIQTVTGPGAHFLPAAALADVEQAGALLEREPIAGVICEFPGNPLLRGVDLPDLAALLRPRGVPLIVDDTPGTFHNVDALAYADIVVSSLTKAFSGVGDVMAGSLVVNASSPLHGRLSAALEREFEDLLWGGDALALEENSRDFTERMQRINATTETVCDALREHPAVARVYYPKFEIPALYAQVCKPGGGYGSLFSILLRDAPRHAPAFYDRLRVSKGPSLGNNFTLACPYTLLAHYGELDWAESLGVSRWLVRVSAGLEAPEDLLSRFQTALPG